MKLAPIAAVVALLAASARAEELYVGDQGQRDVIVLDAATLAELARIDLGAGAGPNAVALTPDGQLLFCVCSGTDEVVVVSPGQRSIIRRLPIGDRHDPLIFVSPQGDRAIVTDCTSDDVFIVDIPTLSVVDADPATPEVDGFAMPGGNFSWPLDFSADGATAYIGQGCATPYGIFPLDLTTSAIQPMTPIDIEYIYEQRLLPDGETMLFTGGARDGGGTIHLARVDTGATVGQLSVPGNGYTWGIALGEGSLAYVALNGFPSALLTVDLSDPAHPAIVHTTPIDAAHGLPAQLRRAGDRLYVATYGVGMLAYDLAPDPVRPALAHFAPTGPSAYAFDILPEATLPCGRLTSPGFLAPINTARRLGTVFPAKLAIRLDGAPLTDAGLAALLAQYGLAPDAPRLRIVVDEVGGSDLPLDDTPSGAAHDPGDRFRYSAEDGHWIINVRLSEANGFRRDVRYRLEPYVGSCPIAVSGDAVLRTR